MQCPRNAAANRHRRAAWRLCMASAGIVSRSSMSRSALSSFDWRAAWSSRFSNFFVLAPAFLQIGLRVQVKLRPVPQDQLAAGDAERVDDHAERLDLARREVQRVERSAHRHVGIRHPDLHRTQIERLADALAGGLACYLGRSAARTAAALWGGP